MLEPLLCIIACYATCVGFVHLAHLVKVTKASGEDSESWIVITRNHQHHIEWILRSLLIVYWLKGRGLRVIVIDRNSHDQTLSIVERLSATCPLQFSVVYSSTELEKVLSNYTNLNEVHVLDLEHTDPRRVLPQYL